MLKLLNNKGLTLIELLAAIVIGGIVIIFATNMYVQAKNSNERIAQEIALRDEADYLMSVLIRDLYTVSNSKVKDDLAVANTTNIVQYELPLTTELKLSSLNTCVDADALCTVKTGFITSSGTTRLIVRGKEIALMNKNISINSNTKITQPFIKSSDHIAPITYEISLVLNNNKKGKTHTMEFKNEVSLINF